MSEFEEFKEIDYRNGFERPSKYHQEFLDKWMKCPINYSFELSLVGTSYSSVAQRANKYGKELDCRFALRRVGTDKVKVLKFALTDGQRKRRENPKKREGWTAQAREDWSKRQKELWEQRRLMEIVKAPCKDKAEFEARQHFIYAKRPQLDGESREDWIKRCHKIFDLIPAPPDLQKEWGEQATPLDELLKGSQEQHLTKVEIDLTSGYRNGNVEVEPLNKLAQLEQEFDAAPVEPVRPLTPSERKSMERKTRELDAEVKSKLNVGTMAYDQAMELLKGRKGLAQELSDENLRCLNDYDGPEIAGGSTPSQAAAKRFFVDLFAEERVAARLAFDEANGVEAVRARAKAERDWAAQLRAEKKVEEMNKVELEYLAQMMYEEMTDDEEERFNEMRDEM